jgi:hypothetical protein
MNTMFRRSGILMIGASLLGVGLAACVAQSEPDPAESNVSSTESDLTSPLSVAPVANACVQPPRPTSRCAIPGGWHWCGCDDGWVCSFCE